MDLKGKCLIARPSINDPLFKKSVVFIYEHTAQGTAGLIINKIMPGRTTQEILQSKNMINTLPPDPIYTGGPVNERAVVMFHTADWRSNNTMQIDNRLSVTSDDVMVYRYSQGDVPHGYRFCVGASVWHPTQIKSEIAANHWLVADLPLSQLFDHTGREQWDIAVEHCAKTVIDRYI